MTGNLITALLCKSDRAKESRRAFIRLSEGGRRRQREGSCGSSKTPPISDSTLWATSNGVCYIKEKREEGRVRRGIAVLDPGAEYVIRRARRNGRGRKQGEAGESGCEAAGLAACIIPEGYSRQMVSSHLVVGYFDINTGLEFNSCTVLSEICSYLTLPWSCLTIFCKN